PPPADFDGLTTFVDNLSPDLADVNDGRGRGRHSPRPRGISDNLSHRIAPRHQPDLLGRSSAAGGDGGGDRFGAEEALDVAPCSVSASPRKQLTARPRADSSSHS